MLPSTELLENFLTSGLRGRSIERDLARSIFDPAATPLLQLLAVAGAVREKYFGRKVMIHQLHNVQNGACPEDCGYCGQNRDSSAPIQPYKLKSKEEILEEAHRAKAHGAYRYCMVMSGRGPDDREIDFMADCIREVKAQTGLRTCLSAGLMDEARAQRLADAGLDRLNHNLNTSAGHYPNICSTHTFQDRIDTLRAAQKAGLSLCSGMIVGMGETTSDLIDLAWQFHDLQVPSIPVNFLVPIPGNQVTDARVDGAPLTPEFVLRVLCLFRLVNPTAEVRIGAGREGHLRSMQALSLHPANSLFVDGYLLTRGSPTAETIRMIIDAGFEVEIEGAMPDELHRLVDSFRQGGTASFAIDDSEQVIRSDRLRVSAPKKSERQPALRTSAAI